MNEANLKPFLKGEDERRNLMGRPRKWYSELVKTQGYSVSQINDVIQVMVSLTMDELKVIWQDEKSPVLEKIIAGALASSIEKKSLYNLETLFSRVFGQPKQSIDQKIMSVEFVVTIKKPDAETEDSI